MLKMSGSAGYWLSEDLREVFERRVKLKKYENINGSTQLVSDQRVAGDHHSAESSAQKFGPRTSWLFEYEVKTVGVANNGVVSSVFHCSPIASTSRMTVWMVATELAFSRMNSFSSSIRVLSHSSTALVWTTWKDWSAISASCAGDAGMSISLITSETRREAAFGSTSERTSEIRRETAFGFGVRATMLRISGDMMGVGSGLREC